MIKRILTSISFVLIVGMVFFYFFQEKFIFINWKKLDRNYQYKFPNQFEEVFIKTDRGNEINALHFKLEKSNPSTVKLIVISSPVISQSCILQCSIKTRKMAFLPPKKIDSFLV